MKLTRQNATTALIVAVVVILFGGFLALALPGENKHDDTLDAISRETTTTERRVTTTRESTTTSTSTFVTTTTALTTATTGKPTTATTKKPSTATTKKPSTGATTTVVAGPSGQVNEHSDNSASFTHGQDGSFSVAATDPPGGADPFRFILTTAAGSGGVSGETASVKFSVSLTNNTAKTINFPGGLKIIVTMRAPNGTDVTFTMTAADVTNITAGETITITQERGVSGYGHFDATATCDVDYG
jgi:hypothetical protein